MQRLLSTGIYQVDAVPSTEAVVMMQTNPTPTTLIGYEYTVHNVTAIAVSSVLGLLMSLTTFILIGATSSVTYNVRLALQ